MSVASAGPGVTPPGPAAVPPGTPNPAAASLRPDLAGAARRLFGDRLDLAAAYAELLATDGVVRGLLGPREAPRIWDRHLLNCAAVAELIPPGVTVLDVGSGAGLPGLVLAIARPDIAVTLVEPLARRTAFLEEAVDELMLTESVRVFHGRAEEAVAGPDPLRGEVVTARAVAPLDRLAGWCLPLTGTGGRLLALKGASAAVEVTEHAQAVHRLGGGTPILHRCGAGIVDPPATVVEIVSERTIGPVRRRSSSKQSRSRRR
ncbi:16S rRNA (guanine(527)-N(7))-methyltransferase RsmG [Micromonospora sp. LOL_024]|uniref:16S rRNA (guanine(527)-N(7))-methyltransferase RsmG n=1 Tax=Micromonospora sp. LOL_024 TaxID=3345412 RepID=UPI003A85AC57